MINNKIRNVNKYSSYCVQYEIGFLQWNFERYNLILLNLITKINRIKKFIFGKFNWYEKIKSIQK